MRRILIPLNTGNRKRDDDDSIPSISSPKRRLPEIILVHGCASLAAFLTASKRPPLQSVARPHFAVGGEQTCGLQSYPPFLPVSLPRHTNLARQTASLINSTLRISPNHARMAATNAIWPTRWNFDPKLRQFSLLAGQHHPARSSPRANNI
jgi:hypothetical protein